MHIVDFIIFIIYMICVFLVGVFFYRKNENREDYYVGSRSIGPGHVGLSVVATDVGGGFSIGLGGLGFLMGLSGSWLLFTGLIGAWLSAVLIIPKIKKIDKVNSMLTYPDFLRHRFGAKVAVAASVISGLGYMGFTGGQVLAGAKLASATILADIPVNIDPMFFAILVISVIIILYTSLGGIKAVIYTDTVQWIILFAGLLFFAIPFAIIDIGGFGNFYDALPKEFFSLTNVSLIQVFNWAITIVPIWLIGMTLYQRMFACKDVKDAKKAWFLAGLFEYPMMAFAGVILGMFGRIYFPEVDSEMGLPLVLKEILPVGIKGIVVAAYFSAIMSTADSCLIASSGNFVNDIIMRFFSKSQETKYNIRISQIVTLTIGILAVVIASSYVSVLDVILNAYSFMVAGLTVVTFLAYFSKKIYKTAGLFSMFLGGTSTLILLIFKIDIFYNIHPTFFGILVSLITYYITSIFEKESIENDIMITKNSKK
jgi:solute:Na+ symporter, SSS family